MKPFHLQSAVEQLANYLRTEILKGRLTGEMPGVRRLAEELGTSPNTMVDAVHLLEDEGLVVDQGHGRRKQIKIRSARLGAGLKIEILLYEMADYALPFMTELKYRLMEAGHLVNFARKTLRGLNMNVKRVEQLVAKSDADAWIVVAGSKPVLEWFAAQQVPTLAMFGCVRDVPPLAGIVPDKSEALSTAVQRLTALGHQRIVMLVREERRKPIPGFMERRFLKVLEMEGIKTGAYNLPEWEINPAGLQQCLHSLLAHTPPTAMIFDEAQLFTAARLNLAQSGLTVPRDVSMLCMDPDPGYAWCQPSVAHIYWDTTALGRRFLKWADRLIAGKADHRQTVLKAKFIDGGTIGPAPMSRSK